MYVGTVKDLGLADNMIIQTRTLFQVPGMTNNGQLYQNYRIIATALGAAMDIASEGTTAQTSAQSNFKTFYTRYRVLAFRVKWSLVNRETLKGAVLSQGPTNDLITKNNSSFATLRINPNFMHHQVVNAGFTGFIWEGEQYVDCAKFLGNKTLLYDDAFAAATNGTSTAGVPSNNIYWNFGGIANGTWTTAMGMDVFLEFTQEVCFFEKSVQSS
jgi:acyl dehydratase